MLLSLNFKPKDDDLLGLVLRTKYYDSGLKQKLEISLRNKDRVMDILKSKHGVTCVEGETTEYGRQLARKNGTISSMK